MDIWKFCDMLKTEFIAAWPSQELWETFIVEHTHPIVIMMLGTC